LLQAKKALDAGHAQRALDFLNYVIRTVEFPGVEDWMLDAGQRKFHFESIYEQTVAFTTLVKSKDSPNKDALNAQIGELQADVTSWLSNMNKAMALANPTDARWLAGEWTKLVAKRDALAKDLQALWRSEKEQRY